MTVVLAVLGTITVANLVLATIIAAAIGHSSGSSAR